MGAPILLGGSQFRINRGSLILDGRQSGCFLRAPDPGAYCVMSTVTTEIQNHGYNTTKPKRGKADDVRLRCIRGDRYIELILIAEHHFADTLEFSLDAWAYTKVHDSAVYGEIADEWRQLTIVSEGCCAIVLMRYQ